MLQNDWPNLVKSLQTLCTGLQGFSYRKFVINCILAGIKYI